MAPMQRPPKRALYFGFSWGGHGLCERPRGLNSWIDVPQGFPWKYEELDSLLLNNRQVPDKPDGRVHWTGGGRPTFWFAFFWWDESGDPRVASNSGFYVEGFPPPTRETAEAVAAEAFAFACSQWPEVVTRQQFPLVLQAAPLGGAPVQP